MLCGDGRSHRPEHSDTLAGTGEGGGPGFPFRHFAGTRITPGLLKPEWERRKSKERS